MAAVDQAVTSQPHQGPLKMASDHDGFSAEVTRKLAVGHADGSIAVISQRVFVTSREPSDRTPRPHITSMISTRDNKIVMSDSAHKKVKVVDLIKPQKLDASVELEETPCDLALLHDDLIALTTESSVIYLLKVAENSLTVASRIKTEVQYKGVAGNLDETLVVSCVGRSYDETKGDDNQGEGYVEGAGHNFVHVTIKGDNHARLEVIDRQGKVLKRLAESRTLKGLERPYHLCAVGRDLYVSDWISHAVFRLDITDGHLIDAMANSDMRDPQQVSADSDGSIYVADVVGRCVLFKIKDGDWRRLLEGTEHSEEGCEFPCAVCVAPSGQVVVAWWKFGSHCLVIAYDLHK